MPEASRPPFSQLAQLKNLEDRVAKIEQKARRKAAAKR
jgi:hypothetical protein